MNDNDYMLNIYCDDWKNGQSWERMASRLKTAANIILKANQEALNPKTENDSTSFFNNTELIPIYLLLMGYALEDLFKGIIICGSWSTNRECLEKDDFNKFCVPRKGRESCMSIANHGLIELLQAKAMNATFTANFTKPERKVMCILDTHVLWAGRYPVSKKYTKKYPATNQIIQLSEVPNETIDTIYEKAVAELQRLIRLVGE